MVRTELARIHLADGDSEFGGKEGIFLGIMNVDFEKGSPMPALVEFADNVPED